MKSSSYRVILVSLLMIFSSLAGCLAGDEEPLPGEVESLGTVMVSTYHVGELVKAVAGDQVTLEYMSQANIPVHDYEPSAEDLIRLQSADIFFYHGLGLEPWVDSTLEGLGGNAPTSIETHRMPSGEDTLDYEGMLVTELCELLTVGPYESTTLAMDEDDASEIHAEYVAHTLSFPEMDDDHDDHGDDDHDDHGDDDHDDHGDDDHDDHGDDGHDDHDEHDHSEHGHATPEETIENPTDCPADTVISIFHMEEGEYTLEFEEVEDFHEFNMAVLKMGGGHAHHDHHGHGDDHGEEDRDRDDHDEHGDEDRDRDDHDEHDEHGDEDRDHDDHEDDITAEQALERFDANNDSHLSWDEFVGMMESMDDDHGDDDHGDDDHGDDDHGDDHDDHDDHDPIEEAMEEYMMDMLMSMFNESDADNDTLLSVDELENFIESMDHLEDDLDSVVTEIMISAFDEDEDGLLSMSEFVSMMEAMDDDHDDHGDHDDHWDPNTCHDSETHETHDEYTNEEDCEAAGYMWMGDEEHDDHGDDDYNETEMMELMFHMFDTNGDESIDASELDMLMEMGEDEHDEHAGHVTIHIEAEGEYGFALPHDVEFYVLTGEDGHDDHDDHDDHGGDEMVCYDMSTHTVDATIDNEADCDAAGLMWTAANSGPGGDDDHGGHDDHGDEEVLNFDPHSWLDPMAFNTQLVVVMESLITAFPSAEADFRSNGDAYAAQLRDLDDAFDAAFGEGGVCMAGGHEKTVAANHNAYSYIAVRYDIQFVTVHGLDPEGEPSPEDVAEVVEHMTEEGINVLFVEEYTGQTAVQSIVEETGATVQILYTMEMAPSDSDDDYMSMMNKNLDNLVAGMGC